MRLAIRQLHSGWRVASSGAERHRKKGATANPISHTHGAETVAEEMGGVVLVAAEVEVGRLLVGRA